MQEDPIVLLHRCRARRCCALCRERHASDGVDSKLVHARGLPPEGEIVSADRRHVIAPVVVFGGAGNSNPCVRQIAEVENFDAVMCAVGPRQQDVLLIVR